MKKIDVCLILADHDYINYKFLKDNAKLIVDTRGRFTKKIKNVIQL